MHPHSIQTGPSNIPAIEPNLEVEEAPFDNHFTALSPHETVEYTESGGMFLTQTLPGCEPKRVYIPTYALDALRDWLNQ